MRPTYFIVAIILIAETCFRIPTNHVDEYDFFLFSNQKLSLTFYLYYLFEHVKIMGLVTILYVENSRYKWLVALFGIDMVSYLLNYSSIWTYVSGFPIGTDIIKLGIFGVIITREALEYYGGSHTHFNGIRNILADACGYILKALRINTHYSGDRLGTKDKVRNLNHREV